jgi:hypothetical protein
MMNHHELAESDWRGVYRSHVQVILAQLFSAGTAVVHARAGEVPCEYQQELLLVRDLVRQIQGNISSKDCLFEDWEYQCANRVIAASWQFGPVSRDALVVFTGYSEEQLHNMAQAAIDARTEAYTALYGSPAQQAWG